MAIRGQPTPKRKAPEPDGGFQRFAMDLDLGFGFDDGVPGGALGATVKSLFPATFLVTFDAI